MAKVLCEIELTSGQRAHLMGGDAKRVPSDAPQRLWVRLVFVNWAGDVPRIVAEYSEHTDALGSPVWQPADKLPLPLVLASLKDITDVLGRPGMGTLRTGSRAEDL